MRASLLLTIASALTTTSALQARAPCTQLCCTTVGTPNNGNIALLLGLLGVVIQDMTTLVGLNCTPYTGACANSAVCCTTNQFNGLINTGCTPFVG